MKKSNVLFLACVALAASIGGGALYLHSPSGTDPSKGMAVTGQSKIRAALAQKDAKRIALEAAQAAPSKAQARLFFQLAESLPTPLPNPVPAGIDPRKLPRPNKVLSTTILNKEDIPNLALLKKGQVIGLPLPDGRSYDGRVNLIKTGNNSSVRIGGSLQPQSMGTFSLSQAGQNWRGEVRLPAENRAFVISTWQDGRVLMQEQLLSDLECMGMQPKDGHSVSGQANPAATPPPAVPLLDSRPGAAAVIYLDFDGEYVEDPKWYGGLPINALPPLYLGKPLTDAYITQVWQAVAEDYAPFNITVTTSRELYDNAAPGTRMRCIITPTQQWNSPPSAGAAIFNSFSDAGIVLNPPVEPDIPCWCFGIYDPLNTALVISHEIGHTLGLDHDGVDPLPGSSNEDGELAYYGGHGSGPTSWGPIMGAPYGKTMTQWSRGEYTNAGNTEDDIEIIAGPINTFGFVTDEDGSTPETALEYVPPDGVVSLKGTITSSNDVDIYKIVCSPGLLNVTCAPAAPYPNFDANFQLLSVNGVAVASSQSATSLSANITFSVPGSGTYYLAVRASENSGPVTGYSDYGSVGTYSLTGKFVGVPAKPVFVIQPVSVTAIEGATVTLTSKAITTGGLTYQWQKDGSDYTGAGAKVAVLKLPAVKSAIHAGTYRVVASNPADPTFKTESDEVTVVVNAKPKITLQPKAATVQAGSTHTFKVSATGTMPLSYVWERNNVPLGPPQVTSSLDPFNIQLELPNVQLQPDAATYRVKITNITGTTLTSSAVALKIDSPPIITTHPAANPIIAVGASQVLKVVVAGKAPFKYQWYKDNQPLATAKAATLTVKGAADGDATYRVEVTNAIGGAVPAVSNNSVVEVDFKPTIVTQPVTPAVATGEVDNRQLSVAAGGDGPFLYQWQKDGKDLPLTANLTAQNATLEFTPAKWTDRGSYKCVVRNRVGMVTSKAVTVVVNSKPVILVHPKDTTSGPTASFTVVAGGNPPLTYQWFRNGTAIPNAKAAKLSLTKLSPDNDSGASFTCIVTNKTTNESAESDPGILTVESVPKVTALTTNPVNRKVVVDGSLTITPTVSGGNLSYQWLKAGKPIIGANGPTFTISQAKTTDAGSYALTITNAAGKATSAAIAIAVLTPPSIDQIPLGVDTIEDTSVSLTVKASGSATLKYQWERIHDGGIVEILETKKTNVLAFPKILETDAGGYRCVVSNEAGSVTSPIANVTVVRIPAPQIFNFYPKRGITGQLVRVTGENLQYIASAKFGTSTAAFTLVSESEAILTVSAPPLDAGVEISVTNKGTGGTATSGALVFTRKGNYVNDQVIDAVLMTGTASSSGGFSVGFTADLYYPDLTAWYWWTAPRAGQYYVRMDASYDSTLGLFIGHPSNPNPSVVSIQDNYSSALGVTGETIVFNATAGQSFLFQAGAWPYGSATQGGVFSVSVAALSLNMAAMSDFEPEEGYAAGQSLNGQNGWAEQSAAATAAAAIVANPRGSHEVHLGGNGVAHAAPTVLTAAEGSGSDGEVVVTFKMGLKQPENGTSKDWFNWTLYGEDGHAMGGLWVSAEDGMLYSSAGDGTQVALEQKLDLGVPHQFEIILDQVAGSWEATMDGVTIASGVKIPATSKFRELCPVWLPSNDGSPHATLIFDDVRVYREEVEETPE